MEQFLNYLATQHSLISSYEEQTSVEEHLALLKDYQYLLFKKEILAVLERFFAAHPEVLSLKIGGHNEEDKNDPVWVRLGILDEVVWSPEFLKNKSQKELQKLSRQILSQTLDYEYVLKNPTQDYYLEWLKIEQDQHFINLLPFEIKAQELDNFKNQLLSPTQLKLETALENKKEEILHTNMPTLAPQPDKMVSKI